MTTGALAAAALSLTAAQAGESARFDLDLFVNDDGSRILLAQNRATQERCILDQKKQAEAATFDCSMTASDDFALASEAYRQGFVMSEEAETINLGWKRWGMTIEADESDKGDRANVEIRMGKSQIRVLANDAPGSESALIDMDNVSAKDARKVFEDFETLDDQSRNAILEALGL
jgi:hypothetical protein